MKNKVIYLDGKWNMRVSDSEWITATVPGSLYSNLLDNGLMEDPFYRENQYEACKLSDNDTVFEKVFSIPEGMAENERVLLHFDGIDTLAEIIFNGKSIGRANNMHRIWEYDVTELLKNEDNHLQVYISSPTKYIAEQDAKRHLWGVATTIPGYNYIRKAHYMFGWDWGPQLPDMGIWRSVKLLGINKARIDSVDVRQKHSEGKVSLNIKVEADVLSSGSGLGARLKLTSPDGEVYELSAEFSENIGSANITLDSPRLWWPNGYGSQPLYTLETFLLDGDCVLESRVQKIGLRTVTVSRQEDEWGEEFCFCVNGVKIFGMGADYIPEDQIIARCTPEKTRNLLEKCVDANFNHIRVWGGGYYPEDWFYELCDEMGLLVWQDFMYACAVYLLTDEFLENTRREAIDNIKRIRHHACLAMWCGNNEMESAWDCWGIPQEEDLKKYYLYQNEEFLPSICKEYCPDVFYWPSSPSSGGGFIEPNSFDRGDVHYWDVWHNFFPINDFREHYFRFCSEYGVVSLPNIKTVKTFAEDDDLNLFSPVMEAHEKCEDGMKKLLYYIYQTMRYPTSFEGLIYASQLMQAEIVRIDVEHMRRHRGRCMGSTYWQINDTNPVISWSSIDYDGRLKALHYYAKKFYAPILLSVDERDPKNIIFNVSNEKLIPVKGQLRWALRENTSEIIISGNEEISVDSLSAVDCLKLDLSSELSSISAKRSRYIEYDLYGENGDHISGGKVIFVQPKHFSFVDPNLRACVSEKESTFEIEVFADAYAKGVFLDLTDGDCIFSDNWFDISGGKIVSVTVDKDTLSREMTLAEFEENLTLHSVYDYR